MAYLNPASQLPQSAAEAIEIVDDRFRGALLAAQAAQPTWISELGVVDNTKSLTTHYPMSFLALKFQETKDEAGRFKRVAERDVELSVSSFDEGAEVELIKLATLPHVLAQWNQVPSELLAAEERFKQQMIVDMLVANTDTCGWDGLTLFNDAHLANPTDTSKGTFDNLQGSAKDVANLTNIADEITAGAEVLDANGDPLGVSFDTIVVPRQKGQYLKNLLKQDFVPNSAGTATMRNPYSGADLKIIVADRLTDTNDWYLADSKLIGTIPPYVVAKLNLANPSFDAMGLRRWTPDNSDYARQNNVAAVSMRVWYGKKPLFPHAIRKIAGA